MNVFSVIIFGAAVLLVIWAWRFATSPSEPIRDPYRDEGVLHLKNGIVEHGHSSDLDAENFDLKKDHGRFDVP